MSVFVIQVVDDLRHGRETWPVLFVLCAASLGITFLTLATLAS